MPANHSSPYAQPTDEQLKIIGKLLIEYSNIEFLLKVLLGRLLITPEFLSRTYTDQMNASQVIEAVKNSLKLHENRYGSRIVSSDLVAEIRISLNEIGKIRSLRNKFAHYCWSRSNDNEIFGTSFSGIIPPKPSDSAVIKNTELISTASAAYKIVDKLQSIILKIPVLREDKELLNKLEFPK